MSDQSIFDRVKEIVVELLGCDPDEVTPEANFLEDLGADSLDYVELLERTEEEFAVDIPDDDSDKFKTVGDAVKYIEAHPDAL